MECKYYRKETKRYPQLGGNPILIESGICQLKMQNPQMQLRVYSALFEKGFEGSFVNNNCPVANINKWNECPFYQSK